MSSSFEGFPSPPFDTLGKIIAAGRTAEGIPPKAQSLLAQI